MRWFDPLRATDATFAAAAVLAVAHLVTVALSAPEPLPEGGSVLAVVPGLLCEHAPPALDGLRCGVSEDDTQGFQTVTLDRHQDLNGELGRLRTASHRLVVQGEGVMWGASRWPVVPEARALDSLPRADQPGRTVVLIVLDTLRADAVADMPHLDAWSQSARRYPNARSNGAWTLPAHASLFTARHPREHGAHGANNEAAARGLDETWPTLAERLGEAGYVSTGLAANRAFLGQKWGLARGFDAWHVHSLDPGNPELPYHQGDRMVDLALQALEGEGARFVFVNLMEPHTPWVPRIGFTHGSIDPTLLPGGGQYGRLFQELIGRRERDEVAQQSWRNAYAAETRFLDAQLGRLLEGIDDDALVVVVSDHGEFLGEHDLVEHSKALYDEVLRVPVFVGGVDPGEDATSIQLDDVPDLILEELGLNPLGVEEVLQVAELHGARARDARWPDVHARTDRRLRAFAEGQRLVIHDLNTDGVEAFDGGQPSDGPWVSDLLERGQAWVEATPEWSGDWSEEPELGPLRALGYLEPDGK